MEQFDYYICYKGERLLGPMSEEEAVKELFGLRSTFRGLYIIAVDNKGNIRRIIKPQRRKR